MLKQFNVSCVDANLPSFSWPVPINNIGYIFISPGHVSNYNW